ncbi:MAG: ferrous iron transport protein B [Culturomica sp.]|jgi:ferrous iron transport protein B|nr:ferrous iron transport protein B [Culturomica sp.]
MEEKFLKLSDVPTGNECIVVKVNGYGTFKNRIMEMGFVRGKKVKVIRNAPLNDPIEYEIMDSHISLRRSEAELIDVMAVSDSVNIENEYNGTFLDNSAVNIIKEKAKTINVALVGNPNSGKTSFFNRATGMKERVGNYSGVTVDAKKAVLKYKDYTINLIDLPGTYSVTEYSPEEVYVRIFITEEHPDIVLNIVDSSNLERNLFLTTQLIDMNVNIVMALNMYDELKKNGSSLDYEQLGNLLGFPIVPTKASAGKGVNDVIEKIIEVYEGQSEQTRHIHINYGNEIEQSIREVKKTILPNKFIVDRYSPRYLSIKTLESDKLVNTVLQSAKNYSEIKTTAENCINELTKEYKDDVRTIITNAKYGFIKGALQETFTNGEAEKHQLSAAIDTVLTHHWFGFPVLLFFIWFMFTAVFYIGDYPVQWIESGVAILSEWTEKIMTAGPLKDLIINGVIAGVGGVLVFLPNILILFFFISLLEDTGYMARAAFIMDKLMHKIGLHGKSFIPLLIGFGCNVPAVMATRTLESRRDRILTMLIIPFMSCSARLPVYILLVSAFFEKNQGLVLLSIYVAGILIGILSALLLKNIWFAKESAPFVMELPPYRMPTVRNTLIHGWNKGSQYLHKMSTVILFASILIWALGYYPSDSTYEKGTPEQLENSYIGKIGKSIEPVIEPLGFDWKMGISIVSGLAAKEVVVSTMGVLYNSPEEKADDNITKLSEKLKQDKNAEGMPSFTPLVAYGFMLFVLIYFPCVATIAAIRKEAGRKWAVFTVLYTTSIAWLVAFCFHQIGKLF